MVTVRQAAEEFLAKKRIAVTGVARKAAGHGSNAMFQRLKARGYEVIPVNPNAEEIDGVRCYPDLASIPGGVEAVLIGTRPAHAAATVRECVQLGIGHVWMHRSVDGGSVDAEAAEYGRQQGLTVIEGGCPLMFGPTADFGHKVMCFFLTRTGKVPRTV